MTPVPAGGAAVVTGQRRRPHLSIMNSDAMHLADNIYSDGEFFFWSWADRIGPVADICGTAVAVDRVLLALGGNR